VFGLDPSLLDFGPPPDEARLPAPVPYDTSMSADATMARLGAQAHPIEAQLRSLRTELEQGAPAPLS
jgi:dTDP-4-dehydrorhamnose reductase